MDAADTLAFVDLETTGGNPAYDRITEIGIVRVQNGELLEEWSSLVNPECPISPYIEAFTGISSEMVADAPRFADVAAAVFEKLRGAVFIAHNARFDHSFLRSEFRKVGLAYSADALCTVKLSRRLYPEHVRHNLDAVIERHGLHCSAQTPRARRCPGALGLVGQVAARNSYGCICRGGGACRIEPSQAACAAAAGSGR